MAQATGERAGVRRGAPTDQTPNLPPKPGGPSVAHRWLRRLALVAPGLLVAVLSAFLPDLKGALLIGGVVLVGGALVTDQVVREKVPPPGPAPELPARPFGRVPAPAATFVGAGHRRAVDELATAARHQPGWFAVVGAAGTGKSTVCIQVLNDVAVRRTFDDRRWYVDLDRVTGADQVRARVTTQLRAADWPSALAELERGEPGVLVLDNSEGSLRAGPGPGDAVLLDLQPATEVGLRVVIGWRGHDVLPTVPAWTLQAEPGALTEGEAIELFRRIAPQHADHPALAELMRTWGYLPLSVTLLAGQAARLRPDELDGLLANSQAATIRSGPQPDRSSSLSFSLDLSIALLTEPERRMLSLVALFPDGIDRDDVDDVFGDVPLAPVHLQRLYEIGLLSNRGAGLRCLPPVGEHVRELGDAGISEDECQRVLVHAARTMEARLEAGGADARVAMAADAGNLTMLLSSVTDRSVRFALARAMVTADLSPALSATATALIAGDLAALTDDEISQLEEAAHSLRRRDRWVASAALFAVLRERRRSMGDHRSEACALDELSEIDYRRGRYDQASKHRTEALAIYRALYDRLGEANTLLELGRIDFQRSRYDQATKNQTDALTIYRALGDQLGEANTLLELGRIDHQQDRYDQATKNQTDALTIYRALDNRLGEANALHELGRIGFQRGRYDQARTYHTEALTIYRALDNRLGEANALRDLGRTHHQQDRYDEATEHHAEALTIYRSIGDRLGEANALNDLGRIDHQRARYDQATKHHTDALTIYRALGSRHGEANALHDLGRIDHQQGRYDRASTHQTDALTIYRALDNRLGEANALHDLGRIDHQQGRYDQATKHQTDALAIYHAIGSRHGEANALNELGRLHLTMAASATGQGHQASAHANFVEAATIFSDVGVAYWAAACYRSATETAPDAETARRHAAEAVRLFRAAGKPAEASRTAAAFGVVVVDDVAVFEDRG